MADSASAELIFLLRREKVPEDVLAGLVGAGVVTVKAFANLVTSVEELRGLAVSDLKMGNETLQDKAKIATLVCVWKTSQARTDEMDKNDAQNELQDRPKTILCADHDNMKKIFEEKFWKLDKEQVPGKSLVEKILGMLEKKHLKAEKLSDAITTEEDEVHELTPVWGNDGRMRQLKVSATVPLPSGTEEFRWRIAILAAAWQFCSYQQTGNAIFVGLVPHVWTEHSEYILGNQVRMLETRTDDGWISSSPSWGLVLSYDYEVRTHAYDLVRTEGKSVVDALRAARKDEAVYRRYFLTPLTLEATRKRPREDDVQVPRASDWGGDYSTNKGGKKGKHGKKGDYRAAKGGKKGDSGAAKGVRKG